MSAHTRSCVEGSRRSFSTQLESPSVTTSTSTSSSPRSSPTRTYENALNASVRRGPAPRRPIWGSCAWRSSRIEPIGSSTSGIQSSSFGATPEGYGQVRMLARVADVSVLAALARSPGRTGLFFDLDGTLSPIVARPEDSSVPAETRAEIERLAARYRLPPPRPGPARSRLVACVTGRAGAAARRILDVDGVTYVGEHGLELEPAAEKWRAPLAL